MQALAVVALVGIIALAGGDDVTQAIKKDRAALQGTWKVTESVSKGEKAPPEELFLIFRGDVILVREEGKTAENFSFLLNPTKKPKEIDLDDQGRRASKGRLDRGIYKIDGDTLRICIQTDKDAPRPTEFASPKDSSLWLVVLQRTKE